MRGPALADVPANRTPGERFDRIALAVMQELWDRFPAELGNVQLGVEEVPILPPHWSEDSIPLSSYVDATAGSPARLVLLRRPIEHRARERGDLDALILTVLVEQVAEVLSIPPEQVHPDYDRD